MKKITIIRGVPGSGKSTLAHTITPHVFEADQYFTDSDGVYRYNPNQIKDAHKDCQDRVEKAMKDGVEQIAVANTFVKKWEYSKYLSLAVKHGYAVDIKICDGDFGNIHGVPFEVVERMKNNFEY